MTLQEVGEYLRRDQSSVSRFEAGIHPPRKDDVIALMDSTGWRRSLSVRPRCTWWMRYPRQAGGRNTPKMSAAG
ncbi:helix-turn-helix transcriptional regulator [Nocardiopsis sp. CNR-923]|uniref:helix-turn-helix domain-containing protein n=1 Tax=Nocardiopsis sp. CNR-923 TaxID=1904965 RepID=UPI0021CC6EA4|nr:helix-turn-helix transcriptional regulator [Nocardiopsis sp. CNR-923]